MKILLIHNRYKNKNIGGEDIVFNRELNALESFLGKKNVFSYEVSNDNIKYMELAKNIFFSKKYYKIIKEIIIKNKIDIVHIHNFFPMLSPSIFKAAKDAGAKVIHTLHNYRWWCIKGTLYRDGKGICEKCAVKKFNLDAIKHKCYRNSTIQSFIAESAFYFYRKNDMMKYIDYFFVLTEFQKNKVISLGLDRNKIIIKPNFNVPLDSSNEIQNVKKNGYLFIGRLDESKGIKELIENWKKLPKNYVLTIIGDGPLKTYVEMNTSENIIYLGRIENEKIKKFIKKAKFLVQSSIWYETFGLTIIEAFQLGTPVIGYNIGTRKDFIKDGWNGFIIFDKQNFVDVIKKSYNFEKYDFLVNNCLKLAKEYEEEKVVKDQINLYKHILNENSW
ncbi:glycosyltransferase [Marinitoga piezophila KA3]|uniref:Glycosyltransferase n=1 Tax=Marinitoga piezophila (strain DSM 14283 / JCM 11233 / KA3) TaxID=443254 RepID=H2J8A8_MARPK|nr:glycosyltransferase [Marinitoga piezophila]AEX85592.1 glycosyltransferase [Marinitoga piezophila KA3]